MDFYFLVERQTCIFNDAVVSISFFFLFIGASLQTLHAVMTTTEVFIVVQVPLMGITDLVAESKEAYKENPEVCPENK